MSQYFEIHPENPQRRLIQRAVEMLRHDGTVIVYPTDSSYALGCHLGDKRGMERIQRIRELSDRHNFTLVCRDLSEIASYARVSNMAYRMLKAHTPGPYTFIFKATKEVPKRLWHAKKKTIGIRVPDHPVTHALLEELQEPIMSTTLILPGADAPEVDAYEIRQRLEHEVDLVIDAGHCGSEPSTVVDFVDDNPRIIRQGLGSTEGFV